MFLNYLAGAVYDHAAVAQSVAREASDQAYGALGASDRPLSPELRFVGPGRPDATEVWGEDIRMFEKELRPE
eukprot:8359399-Pyramimonas_sp.AAC.1